MKLISKFSFATESQISGQDKKPLYEKYEDVYNI